MCQLHSRLVHSVGIFLHICMQMYLLFPWIKICTNETFPNAPPLTLLTSFTSVNHTRFAQWFRMYVLKVYLYVSTTISWLTTLIRTINNNSRVCKLLPFAAFEDSVTYFAIYKSNLNPGAATDSIQQYITNGYRCCYTNVSNKGNTVRYKV